jgi:hypothetical protein
MALYFVDYDLRNQRDYQKLYDALNLLGAVRILESLWAFKHNNTNCVEIRNYLRQHMDEDDGIIVSQVVDWAYFNAIVAPPNS